MITSLAVSILLPFTASIGPIEVFRSTSVPQQALAHSISAEYRATTPSWYSTPPAQATLSLVELTHSGPRLPHPQPRMAADAEQWFNKNAKTIAIVAVAVVLVLILTN